MTRIQFPEDDKPASQGTPTPAPAPTTSAPAPRRISFADVPAAPAKTATPAPAPLAPKPHRASFENVPETPRKVVVPPPVPPPPTRVSFDNVPEVPRAPARPAGPPVAHRTFENPLTDLERRALDQVKQTAPEMYAKCGPALEGCIRQLIPFNLATLSVWGDSALTDNAQLVGDMANAQRRFSGLTVNETIAEALEAARPNSSIFNKLLRKNTQTTLNAFRIRAAALKVQLDQLMPVLEDLRSRAMKQSDRLPMLLACMSAAASTCPDQHDPAVDIAVQNRRTVLTQATQQAQLILPQVNEMRRQLVEQGARLTEFLTVTLPALDAASVQR